MKKPRSNRSAPRTGESTTSPARVLLFPCLVQLPPPGVQLSSPEAPRPAGTESGGKWDRFQLVLENGGPRDAARTRARSGR